MALDEVLLGIGYMVDEVEFVCLGGGKVDVSDSICILSEPSKKCFSGS